ncbi:MULTISPECIES: outer membrane protein assembly factor BamE [unclassified Shimia]|uniref:outer membrane protein assembly factor BamE n=1 Tax=unclassified Shimia TaxID=2630038 RepID=UPI001ADC850C|nr:MULTISPECIES: outer membrane protein assembly factor BamE [unclassified Shimia]MBO9473382.1 outer membrane protein assembly factor BamE [Shimia sp. R10_1]MDA5555412.1 outer membrane protein assembly factor BamE [Shimia sp. MMG029]
MKTRKTMIKVTVMGALVLALASCATRYRNHGYVPSAEELASITLGVDTRDTIADTFGPPSASGVLNDSGYLYVRSRVKHFGPRRPEVVDRQIVAIGFDNNGIARNIEQFALEDGQVIPLARRITDNNIESGGLLRQLGRNLGNFSPIGAPAPGSGDF